MKKRTISLILFCLILGSSVCIASPRLSGSIKKNIYTPLSGRYRVPVPVENHLNGKTSDDVYWVMFTDDFYKMFQIELIPMPEEEKLKAKKMDRKEYLKGVLYGMYLPTTILKDCPAASVSYLSWHADLQGGAGYVEVAMPEGSLGLVSINGQPEKKVDAERGLLLFIDDGDLCVVSTMLSQIRKSGETTEDRMKRMRTILEQNTVDFMKTIEFTNHYRPTV